MFALNWIWTLLYKIGLLQKRASILLVGLDNAGKTTLLYKLKHGTVRSFVPTQRAQTDEMVIGNVRMRAWDLGGHEEVRHIWQEYYVQVDAIIFVVDSAEYERMQEAKRELHVLLDDPALINVPFLVLGNKSDLRAALKPEQLVGALGLGPSALPGAAAGGGDGGNGRPLRLFSCSLVEGHGYAAAFEWLASVL